MATLAGGRKTCAVPGTAEALATVSIAVTGPVHIRALPTNTGVVAIGGAEADTTAGVENGIVLADTDSPITIEGVDELGDIFVDAAVADEGVSFTYAARS